MLASFLTWTIRLSEDPSMNMNIVPEMLTEEALSGVRTILSMPHGGILLLKVRRLWVVRSSQKVIAPLSAMEHDESLIEVLLHYIGAY
jgi:hypothetical protein